MSRGEVSSFCQRCMDEESSGHTSERVKMMHRWSMDELLEFEKTLTLPAQEELELGFKISSRCNLACRSCQPSDSSLFQQVTGHHSLSPMHDIDLLDNERYWNLINDQISQYQQQYKNITVHPIGGETFVTEGFSKMIDWLCETGLSKSVRLRVTTNFTVPIEKWIDRFLNFRQVQLILSIDSVGINYKQVRWPADWAKIERNIEAWTSLVAQNPEKLNHTVIETVFTINNIFYINEILDWWHVLKKRHQWFEFDIDNLHCFRPECLKVENVPDPYRGMLLESLVIADRHEIFGSGKHQILKNFIVNMIQSLSRSSGKKTEQWRDYLRYTAEYDRKTNSDSFTGNRHLFEMLDQEDQTHYKNYFSKPGIEKMFWPEYKSYKKEISN